MNSVRIIVGELFQSPMSNMSVPAYINYVNTAGKISARSMLELDTVILTLLENQEKVNQENAENFKQIFDILAKIISEKETVKEEVKVTDPVNQPAEFLGDKYELFICPECKRVCASEFGLKAHLRSHKPKV